MDLTSQVRSGLQAQGLPAPTIAWIQNMLPSRTPMPPLLALVATVRARLMAADIANGTVLDPAAPALPANITNQQVKESKLDRDVLVQVLDIENLGKSKWEQVEELEAIARGEQSRGREIIRLPTGDQEDDDAGTTAATQFLSTERPGGSGAPGTGGSSKNSTHRLVLQDCRGVKVYGLELERMEKIGIGTLNIGEKIMLKKGAVVARGVILLHPTTCNILGGRIEAWQKAWIDGRLTRLIEAIGADARN